LMKKPGLIDTTVRLFPDKKSAAATTRTTTKGHVTGPLNYSPLKSKENILNHIHRTGLTSRTSLFAVSTSLFQ
jgi:hypothetical protein